MMMMVREKEISLQIFVFYPLGPISSSQQNKPCELVDIESWFLRSDLLYKYECDHFDENDKAHPRYNKEIFLFEKSNSF